MSSDSKRTLIVEAATKRFIHFGMAKTTMADIAKDLSFSKALLYYYYPDKNSLYTAVLDRVIKHAFEVIEAGLDKIDNCELAMMYVLDKRIAFIMHNYNLLDYTLSALQHVPDEMAPIIRKAHLAQRKTLKLVFDKGVVNGELKEMDTDEMADIMILALEGMRLSILKERNEMVFPSKEEFDKILKLQKKLSMIILDGLRGGQE